jgi:hypothetical protein
MPHRSLTQKEGRMRSLVEWGRTEATPPSPNIRDNTHMTFIYINHISLRERDPNTKTVEV